MQEGRAQKALALLRQRLTVAARVRRDGRWRGLPAAKLVPGISCACAPVTLFPRTSVLPMDQNAWKAETDGVVDADHVSPRGAGYTVLGLVMTQVLFLKENVT